MAPTEFSMNIQHLRGLVKKINNSYQWTVSSKFDQHFSIYAIYIYPCSISFLTNTWSPLLQNRLMIEDEKKWSFCYYLILLPVYSYFKKYIDHLVMLDHLINQYLTIWSINIWSFDQSIFDHLINQYLTIWSINI